MVVVDGCDPSLDDRVGGGGAVSNAAVGGEISVYFAIGPFRVGLATL